MKTLNSLTYITALAFAAVVFTAAPVSAAETSRHTVYAMDREAVRAPAAKTLLAQDTLRTDGGDAYARAEFYAINEPLPEPKQEKAEVSGKKAWYWVGGAGVALVAGVAAWLVLGEDEKPANHVIAAF